MAKQTFTTGQVLSAAQMTSLQQTAMLGGDTTAKVASYTLVAADAGTTVAMSNAGSTTITVNTALFAAGDIVTIQNRGAGVCTVTAGTATVNTSGSLVLAQYQGGVLYFTSTSAAIFFQFATPESGDITAVTAGTGLSGGGTSGAVSLAIDTAVTADLTTAQTLTNKKLSDSTTTIVDVTDATKAIKFDVAGTTATTGTIATAFTTAKTLTLPDATDTLVGKNTTDTLTNKTLTSPALTTPTISTATTNGDILYGTGSGALARLGIGSSAQVLTVASGIPSWATPGGGTFVGVSAAGSQTTTVTNGSTYYAAIMNVENFDTSAFHDNSTNNTRITIPTGKGGYYLITAQAGLENASGTPGSAAMFVRVNGSGTFSTVSTSQINDMKNANGAVANNSNKSTIVGVLSLAAGDYFEVLYNTTNGNGTANLSILTTATYLGA